MNLTSVLGFAVTGVILWFGVISGSPNPALFMNTHALILVVGGTTAAAMIAFPMGRLLGIVKMLIFGVIFKRQADHRQLVCEIISAAVNYRSNPGILGHRPASHPFLEEGFRLVGEGVIPENELREVLVKRSQYFRRRYKDDAKLLTALAKFPPAFGLLGATTGMISMMTNLGKGGQEMIGPAMAVALVATFWGIAVANFLLLPLADHANKLANDDTNVRKLIIEGLLMLKKKNSPMMITEVMNSHLPVNKRVKLAMYDGAVSMQSGTTENTVKKKKAA